MNKFILLSILISLISSEYVSLAATCLKAPNQVSLNGQCVSDSLCLNSYCDGTSKKCTKFIELNANCNTTSQCSPSLTCGSNGKCSYFKNSIGGEDCAASENCNSDKLQCTSNICSLISTCLTAQDCGFNHECSTGNCIASGAVDASCTSRYDCNQGLVCTFKTTSDTSTTCQLPWTKKLGDKCNSSPDDTRIPFFIDCDIADGLICAESKCVNVPTSGSCKSCKVNTDCQGFEVCSCDASGVGYCKPQVFINKKCKDTFAPLMECSTENNCPMSQSLLLNKGSCVQQNCHDYTCNMGNCFEESAYLNLGLSTCSNFTVPPNLFTVCAKPITTEPASSSSTLLPSLLFLLILFINLLI